MTVYQCTDTQYIYYIYIYIYIYIYEYCTLSLKSMRSNPSPSHTHPTAAHMLGVTETTICQSRLHGWPATKVSQLKKRMQKVINMSVQDASKYVHVSTLFKAPL